MRVSRHIREQSFLVYFAKLEALVVPWDVYDGDLVGMWTVGIPDKHPVTLVLTDKKPFYTSFI